MKASHPQAGPRRWNEASLWRLVPTFGTTSRPAPEDPSVLDTYVQTTLV